MDRIVEQYKDRLHVVCISTDTDKMWQDTAKTFTMSWHNWSDGKQNTGAFAHYDLGGIPCYVLISPEGIVLKHWMGGHLEDELKEVLGE